MPRIHPSACIDGDVTLADDVLVGPGCVITGRPGPVRIGAGTVLRAQVHIEGPCTIGERNTFYPCTSAGFPPQDVSFDPALPGPGLVIGDDNIFREGFTAHRGKTQLPTRIGNGNYWMANSHVGHDAVVGNRCIIANGAMLGGHVEMADRVVVGGNATIHQFVRVGEGALISGLTGMSKDLCPWFTLTAINVAGSINVIGLRRAGASPQRIDAVRWVYRTICRTGLTIPRAIERLRERESDPIVAEYIAFATRSQRGVLTARGRGSDQPKTASRAGSHTGAGGDGE